MVHPTNAWFFSCIAKDMLVEFPFLRMRKIGNLCNGKQRISDVVGLIDFNKIAQ